MGSTCAAVLRGIEFKKRTAEPQPVTLETLERFKQWLRIGGTMSVPVYNERSYEKRVIGRRVYRIEEKYPHCVTVSYSDNGIRKRECLPYVVLYCRAYGDHEGSGKYLMIVCVDSDDER